jgi:hypothetical protein
MKRVEMANAAVAVAVAEVEDVVAQSAMKLMKALMTQRKKVLRNPVL